MSRVGLLVMAYGGPDSLEDVEPYLLDVRGFRDTPKAIVEEVRERYDQIGGRSPILERTCVQAEALQQALSQNGHLFDAEVGMHHWHPYIRDALARLERRGIRRAVGLVMAPHYSRMSVGKYFEQTEAAGTGVAVAQIHDWHLLRGYVRALADRVRATLHRFPAAVRAAVPVVFTAHSLPACIRTRNDPYPDQLAATVRAVMDLVGERPHRFAYQSAAMTPDRWLGPDVGDVLEKLAGQGVRNVLLAPIGFVCEHVEILYDIDIELRERAAALGVRVERIEMLNDHPEMIADLATLVRDRAAEAGWL